MRFEKVLPIDGYWTYKTGENVRKVTKYIRVLKIKDYYLFAIVKKRIPCGEERGRVLTQTDGEICH